MPEHPLSPIMKLDPKLIAHLRATDEVVYTDGALSRKTKLLIALAFDAAHGAGGGRDAGSEGHARGRYQGRMPWRRYEWLTISPVSAASTPPRRGCVSPFPTKNR